MSLTPAVLSVLVMDGDGNRIISKYYKNFLEKNPQEQAKFEQKLFKKTKNNNVTRSDADIIMLDNVVALFRVGGDTRFYVVGGPDEVRKLEFVDDAWSSQNEIILNMVLDALYTALHSLLRGNMDSRNLLDNLETVMLSVDELIDGGIILEIDPQNIVNRVLMRSDDAAAPITDMSVSQALATAKDQLFKSMGTRDDTSWG